MPEIAQLCINLTIADASDHALLAAVLAAGPLASITLSPAPTTTNALAVLKPCVQLAQAKGVATLINADATLARTLRADGVHVPWSDDQTTAYADVRGAVGTHMIVGADAGRSRDMAMHLGEAGADYVAFGIPGHVGDRATAEARQLDLIAWWSDIFQVPVMAGNVTSVEHAARLTEARADFICIDLTGPTTPDAATVSLKDYHAAITSARALA